ncbi:MAG: hypothetical protein PHQ04_11520 [Opitutaceae bacterium]|nr:hypothetical protein [Opitutaceae bacterium]
MSSPRNTPFAPNRLRTDRGSALITVLLLAAIVAFIGMHLLDRSLQESRLAARSFYLNAALNLAENGVEEAMWAANNNTLSTSSGWTLAGDGTGALVRTTTGLTLAQGSGEIYLRVDSPATSQPVLTSLGVVRLPGQPVLVKQLRLPLVKRALWANGMVARGIITFSGNAVVDSYDSSIGVYNASTNRTDQATVASIATALDPIVLNSNATIYGYVATAGAEPDVNNNGRIYGATTPSSVTVDPMRVRRDFSCNLPDVTAPTGSAYAVTISGSLTLPRDGDVASANGRYLYTTSSISISGNNALSIKGPVDIIVTGSTSVSGNGSISVGGSGSTNASVGIYAAGSVSLGGNGMANATNLPINATIYGTAPASANQTITVSGNGEMIGTIYAPNATLSLSGNGATCGAVIANSITLGGNGNFHYDVRLATASSSDRYFRPAYWIELTDPANGGTSLARDNREPFNTVL